MKEKLGAAMVYATFAAVAGLVVGSMIWNAGSLTRNIEADAATVGAGVQPAEFGGRCTLTSNTPVLSGTVTSATTLYYTPYTSNRISLYNGSDLVLYEFAELSNITSNSSTGQAGPLSAAASSVYDYFAWFNGTTVVLTRGPAWTTSSVRSMGLSRVQGVLANDVAIANGPAAARGTYVCTAGTDAGATINYKFGSITNKGGQAIFGVWNMYNRRQVSSGGIGDSTDSWTPQVSANNFGPVNASSGTSVVIVRGLDEDAAVVEAKALCAANNTFRVTTGIGLDSASVLASGSVFPGYLDGTTLTSTRIPQGAMYNDRPGIGMHQFFWAEQATGTATCFGDGGAAFFLQTGMFFNQPM